MTFDELALRVKSNFKRLTESDIVGRIMLLSGRNLERSLNGYVMMREKGMLDSFVDPQTDGKFTAMLNKYPNLAELIERLDCVPGKMEIKTAPKPAGYVTPERTDLKKLIEGLKLPDF